MACSQEFNAGSVSERSGENDLYQIVEISGDCFYNQTLV